MTRSSPTPSDLALERAATPFRERDAAGVIQRSPAFADLSPEEREQLFHIQLIDRSWERLVHESGLSGTARTVLARLHNVRQAGPRE